MSPAIPISAAQEAERLVALQPYKQLEAQHNVVFERIAELTARLFSVSMAQLSLVGAEVVTYPGNVSTPRLASRLQRADTICAVAVYRPEAPTVFTNLRAMPCPWISAAAQKDFSFYAGYPLQTADGKAIGMLCVLDHEPREFTAEERALLRRMAGIATNLLDLELLTASNPAQSPAIWAALSSRIQLSLQRIETLTALAQFEESTHTPAALAYRNSMQEERMLIAQDIEFQLKASFARLGQQ